MDNTLKKFRHPKMGWTAKKKDNVSYDAFDSHGNHLFEVPTAYIEESKDWEMLQSPQFVSDDGKDIYPGDEYFVVDHNYNVLVTVAKQDNVYIKGIPRFSSRELAIEHVVNNRAILSLKDIEHVLEMSEATKIPPKDYANTLTRQKLFPDMFEPRNRFMKMSGGSVGETIVTRTESGTMVVGHDPITAETEPTEKKPEDQPSYEWVNSNIQEAPVSEKIKELANGDQQKQVRSPYMNQMVMQVLGEGNCDFGKLKRTLVSRHPKERISDTAIYKALDELEAAFLVKKEKDGKHGNFIYSM